MREERDLGHGQITSGVAVCEKLAAVLMLIDRFDEARAVALDGLARTPVEDTLRAAKLQHLLASIECQDNRLGRRPEALEAAEKLIGPCGLDDDQERVDVWLAVQLDKARAACRCNELERRRLDTCERAAACGGERQRDGRSWLLPDPFTAAHTGTALPGRRRTSSKSTGG